MSQKIKEFDTIEGIRKKLKLILAGRLRRKKNIIGAINTQDLLSEKSGDWSGEDEIKKWREMR